MQSITLISSSPPGLFARSPTPASSPSLPSPNTLINPEEQSPHRFKISSKVRHGFGIASTGAKTPLQPRYTGENIPLPQTSTQEHLKTSHSTTTPSKKFRNFSSASSSSSRDVSSNVTVNGDERSLLTTETSATPLRLRPDDNQACESINEDIKITEGYASTSALLLGHRAAPRRLDWTPPKNTGVTAVSGGTEGRGFGDILDSFSYKEVSKPKIIASSGGCQAPTKRRKLELVSRDDGCQADKVTTVSGRNDTAIIKSIPSSKGKLTKKKSMTITARATSNYFGEDERETTPLMQYLSTTASKDESDLPKASKSKSKRATSKAKKGKSQKPEIIVLSPESALKQYDGQDLLFGTASQIAREESPTFLRQTIQALRDSEASFQASQSSSAASSTRPTLTRKISNCIGSRNLWTAASRDEEDSLLDIDTLNVIRSPPSLITTASELRPSLRSVHDSETTIEMTRASSANDIRSEFTGVSKSSSKSAQPLSTFTKPGQTPSKVPREVSHLSARSLHTEAERNNGKKQLEAPAAVPSGTPKPVFAGMSTTELSSKLKSYGFKPIKKRDKMIDLLERCWDDKHKQQDAAENEDPVSVAATHGDLLTDIYDIAARPAPKVPKPRARRKKDEAASLEPEPEPKKRKASTKRKAADDAVDVASTTTKPKKTRAGKGSTNKDTTSAFLAADASSAALDIHTETRSNNDSVAQTTSAIPEQTVHPSDRSLSDPSSAPDMSDQITLAVTSFKSSPTHNHQLNPSFHEKILMFDPIVVEDLAAWLNTTGLREIGEDREVSAIDVRTWCEDQGICCLGLGGGWRGGKIGKSAGVEVEP